MKKYLSYILILIVLVGLFSPTTQVNAEPCTGRNDYGPTPAGCTGPVPSATTLVPGAPVAPAIVNSNYQLLAPLPGISDNFNPEQPNALGAYLNQMIKIFIGLCAVLSVVMIIVGGLEYMTSELAHTKEAGKERIWQAVLGLLIALGSYALLNTINPDLLKSDINIPVVTVKVENFQISGALSRNGTPSVVNFNKEAYPAAKAASEGTGVDETLVLAIFAQETSGGANTGGCLPANANMSSADITALGTIVGSNNVSTTNVSCAGAVGHGGAIGLTQFLPSTWLQYSNTASGLLGHPPDPWNVNDALMVTALKLKADGGEADPRAATCKYFGQCSSGGVNYADQIAARMASIKQQIADANKK